MDPERWRKIEALYGAALAVEPSRRAALLEDSCAGDESLRSEVESLLAHAENAGDFLKEPALEMLPEVARAEAGDGKDSGPQTAEMAGLRISHYQILEKLGAGGMGVVYKAQDARLGRSVALKFVKAQFSERWEREARAVAALNHPHIATLYDVGAHEDAPYLAMEYVQGKPLKGPLPVKEVVKYGIQIADALAAAHAAGIVHRDLKPANILVTEKGAVKILDFGLAKLRERARELEPLTSTVSATISGTPGYMSPEQVEGKPVDSRSDIFSFGCVLYELVSGQRAFQGDSLVSVLAATATKEPEPLENVPEELERLIRRCLKKDPEQRWQHIGDARIALEEARDGPSRTVTRPARSSHRSSLSVSVACIAAAALLALATQAWLTRNENGVDLSSYKLRPFLASTRLAYAGGNSGAAWSPDGRFIAFVATPEGMAGASNQLYVQGLDWPDAAPLTNPPITSVGTPAWSPDSSELYFPATSKGARGIWKVPRTGGAPTLVQPDSYEGELTGTYAPSISPDGRTLAYVGFAGEPRVFAVWIKPLPDGAPRLYETAPFKANGYNSIPCIAFAPDGEKIIVGADPDARGRENWLLPWPPGKPRQILRDLPRLGTTPNFTWMPDSKHVLFFTRADAYDSARLFMGNVETGRFWPVFASERNSIFPSVPLSDGSKAVYASLLTQFNVVEVPLDGGPARMRLERMRRDMMPAFSPKEAKFVYVTDRQGGLELWEADLSGGSAPKERLILAPADLHLASGPAHWILTPAVSPKGDRIAVGVHNHAGGRLYITGTTGPAPVKVTAEEVKETAPTWSPDGDWIAYLSVVGGRQTLAKVRSGTSQKPMVLVERGVGSTPLPEWSPTGEWIAFADTSLGGTMLVDPNDPKNRRLLSEIAAPHTWSRDGKSLYQVRCTTDCSLWRIDVATRKEHLVRSLGNLQPSSQIYPGVRVTTSFDGKSILYSVNRTRSQLWILEGIRIPRPWFIRMWGLR